MLDPEQEQYRSVDSRSFIALGSGGRPIGSLLNPYNANTTFSTPSLRSDVYASTDSLSSCESTPLIGLRSTPPSSTTTSSADQHNSTSALELQLWRSYPRYTEEEVCFVWYHRVDLKKDWGDVRCAFNARFPTKQRPSFQGMQSRYYRYLYNTWKVPKITRQARVHNVSEEYAKKYGLQQWTKKSYPWMTEGEVAS